MINEPSAPAPETVSAQLPPELAIATKRMAREDYTGVSALIRRLLAEEARRRGIELQPAEAQPAN